MLKNISLFNFRTFSNLSQSVSGKPTSQGAVSGTLGGGGGEASASAAPAQAPSPLQTPTQQHKKQKSATESMEETFLRVANKVANKCDEETNDQDTIFSKLVASELKEIKDGKGKSLLKIKILQLIHDAK